MRAKWPLISRAYPSYNSNQEYFYSLLDGMLVHRRVTPIPLPTEKIFHLPLPPHWKFQISSIPFFQNLVFEVFAPPGWDASPSQDYLQQISITPSPQRGFFIKPLPPLWKFQISSYLSFKIWSLTAPVPQEFPVSSLERGVWIFSGTIQCQFANSVFIHNIGRFQKISIPIP